MSEKEQMVADMQYLIEQLAPTTNPKEVIPGLSKMFYATNSFEGDVALVTRIKQICDQYNINIVDTSDDEDFADE